MANRINTQHPRRKPGRAWLSQTRPRRYGGGTPASEGFSLPLALLVGASALFGTLAMLNRAQGSNQIRSTESKAIDARDAAEIGMTRIIAELNRPCNRRLLVNTPLLAAADNPGTIAASSFLSSPCEEVGGAPADLTSQQTFNSTGTLLDNEVQVPGTDGRIRYTLKRISTDINANNEFDAFGNANPAFNVTVGFAGTSDQDSGAGRSGTITLDVTGRVVENGATISTYNLRKTYAVIPKCCGQSYTGYTINGEPTRWGNATGFECGVASGYGLILGTKRDISKPNDKGSLNVRNSTVLIETPTASGSTLTALNRVYCTVPSSANPIEPADCPFTAPASNPASPELVRRNFTMPDVPYPQRLGTYAFASNLPTVSGPPAGVPEAFNNVSEVNGFARLRACDASIPNNNTNGWLGINNYTVGQGSNRRDVIGRLNSVADFTTQNNPSLGCKIIVASNETINTREFSSWSSSNRNTLKWQLGRLCTQVTWNGVANTIYCNLDSLILDGATITFDTAGSNGSAPVPIILSFPNGVSSSPSSAASSPFLSSGSRAGTLRQINSSRPGERPRLQDLSIYGCAAGQSSNCLYQAISSKGGATLTLDNVFVYAPFASLTSVNSALVFRGAYWGNNMTLNVTGSSFVIPAGAADGVIANFPSWAARNQLNLAQDYIARTPISVSSF